MRILAIETSCDETAISILDVKRQTFNVLSNVVSSQMKLHAKWGGVVPSLAKREHIKNLPIVLRKALKSKTLNLKSIDLIAVTIGPGLEPALWTGINFAKELAEKWSKPLVPINHMEGHLFSVFLRENREGTKHEARNTKQSFEFRISNFEFPAIALLVSGGHTQLVLTKDWLKYKILGETRDDAAGEAFDKVARMLNLGYPGGPLVAALATRGPRESALRLPRPMIHSENYDFSFSGLKTAVLYKVKDLKKQGAVSCKLKAALCVEFQQAVIDVLISKTTKAAKEYKAKTIILAGGVAANKELRKQIEKAVLDKIPNSKFLIPNSVFCGDNAAMIALAAYFRYSKNKEIINHQTLKAQGNLKIK